MTDYTIKGGQVDASDNNELVIAVTTGITAATTTPWTRFANCDIVAQVTGDATAFVATIQRSATNPDGPVGALPGPADDDGFDGDLTAGIAPNIYTEAGVGWWRWNVTTCTGETLGANCSLAGVGGGS